MGDVTHPSCRAGSNGRANVSIIPTWHGTRAVAPPHHPCARSRHRVDEPPPEPTAPSRRRPSRESAGRGLRRRKLLTLLHAARYEAQQQQCLAGAEARTEPCGGRRNDCAMSSRPACDQKPGNAEATAPPSTFQPYCPRCLSPPITLRNLGTARSRSQRWLPFARSDPRRSYNVDDGFRLLDS